MDTALITMEPVKAKQAFLQYREAVRGRHRKEDEILMRGYKHLSKGKQCLDLVASMKKAGLDNQYLPKLAIARANWVECWIRKGEHKFTAERYVSGTESRSWIDLPHGTFTYP